jgi:hypothetical protein
MQHRRDKIAQQYVYCDYNMYKLPKNQITTVKSITFAKRTLGHFRSNQQADLWSNDKKVILVYRR